MREAVYFDDVRTRFGTFRLAASERGLTAVQFPRQFVLKKQDASRKIPTEAKKVLKTGKHFIKDYFSGKQSHGFHIPVDWRSLSLFETRVLKTLRKTPPSSTLSYSDLAKRSGCQAGARAVGNALARNPLPILIPCHRVVRKDQSLGGFSGGLHWKRTLLSLESSLRGTFQSRPKQSQRLLRFARNDGFSGVNKKH